MNCGNSFIYPPSQESDAVLGTGDIVVKLKKKKILSSSSLHSSENKEFEGLSPVPDALKKN